MGRAGDPQRRVLPFSAWPEIDRASWATLFSESDDPFAEKPQVKWALRTKQTNLEHYGRWLGFLSSEAFLDKTSGPAERVTVQSVTLYLNLLKQTVSPWTCVGRLVGLEVVIRAFAPDKDWRWLRSVCRRIHTRARATRDKLSRIRPTDEVVQAALGRLRALPAHRLSVRQAVAYRDALMLALLALRPLRAKNFVQLEIDKHIIRVGDEWLIVVPGEETKNGQHLEYRFPKVIMPWMERYIREVRSVLKNEKTKNHLWLAESGGLLTRHTLRKQIVKLTRTALGSALNPHLLRDCAASTLASTGQPLVAASLLGHRHFATTERYYVQSKNLDVSRRINRLLQCKPTVKTSRR